MKHFGQKIRRLRRKQGLSQQALSERSGLIQKHISMIETQVESPDKLEVGTLKALAKGLKVEIGELTKGA